MALVSTVECTTAMGHIAGANRHEEISFPKRLLEPTPNSFVSL
jgi:hypothetical protein